MASPTARHKARKGKKKAQRIEHTEDSNGDALGQLESIGANEGGDLAQWVDLVVVLGMRLSLDELEIKTSVLAGDAHSNGAWVFLGNGTND